MARRALAVELGETATAVVVAAASAQGMVSPGLSLLSALASGSALTTVGTLHWEDAWSFAIHEDPDEKISWRQLEDDLAEFNDHWAHLSWSVPHLRLPARLEWPGEGLEPRDIDERLRALMRLNQRNDHHLMDLMIDFHVPGLFVDLEFTSITHYIRERLGLSSSCCKAGLRLGWTLRRFPTVAQALRQGRLNQAQARLICRVADDPWIEKWIEHARGTTVRFLKEDVEAAERQRNENQKSFHKSGGLPSRGARKPSPAASQRGSPKRPATGGPLEQEEIKRRVTEILSRAQGEGAGVPTARHLGSLLATIVGEKAAARAMEEALSYDEADGHFRAPSSEGHPGQAHEGEERDGHFRAPSSEGHPGQAHEGEERDGHFRAPSSEGHPGQAHEGEERDGHFRAPSSEGHPGQAHEGEERDGHFRAPSSEGHPGQAHEGEERDGHSRAPSSEGHPGQAHEGEERDGHFRAPSSEGHPGQAHEGEERDGHFRAPGATPESGANEGRKQPVVPAGLPFRQQLKHLVQAYASGKSTTEFWTKSSVTLRFWLPRDLEPAWNDATRAVTFLQGRVIDPALPEDVVQQVVDSFLREWAARALEDIRKHPIIEAGGWKCSVPTCTNRAWLEKHHIEYLSQGGSDFPANQAPLCFFHHHQGVHAGLIVCKGTAPDGLVWFLGIDEKGVHMAVCDREIIEVPARAA